MSRDEPLLFTVMYHYVRDVETTPFPDIKAVSISEFRRHVNLIQEQFETPPLEACIEFLEGRWQPNRDICLLTFDDGLIEHHDTAAPILDDAGITASFFLPTAAVEDHEVLTVHMNHFLLAWLGTLELRRHIEAAALELDIGLPDSPDPNRVRSVYRWDDDETARLKYLVNHQLPPEASERLLAHVFPQVLGSPAEFARSLYVDWAQARALQEAGFSVGGHSHHHKVLSNMDEESQWQDLAHSMSLLRSNLGNGSRGFAYPYGKPATYTTGTIAALHELGHSCAFNTTVDRARPGTSRWEIPRIDPKDL